MIAIFFLIDLDKLLFNIVRVGAGQKYDSRSPIFDVLLDNIVKHKMNNPLHGTDVSYLVIIKFDTIFLTLVLLCLLYQD